MIARASAGVTGLPSTSTDPRCHTPIRWSQAGQMLNETCSRSSRPNSRGLVGGLRLRGIWQTSPEFLKQGRHAHRAGPPCPPFIFQKSALPLRHGSRGETRQGSTRYTLKPEGRAQDVQDCLDAWPAWILGCVQAVESTGNGRSTSRMATLRLAGCWCRHASQIVGDRRSRTDRCRLGAVSNPNRCQVVGAWRLVEMKLVMRLHLLARHNTITRPQFHRHSYARDLPSRLRTFDQYGPYE